MPDKTQVKKNGAPWPSTGRVDDADGVVVIEGNAKAMESKMCWSEVSPDSQKTWAGRDIHFERGL